MIRILLPLAVIAAILFGPLKHETVTSSEFGTKEQSITGMSYVKSSLDCWRKGNFSLKDDCAPQGELKGQLLAGAVGLSGLAAVVGILGLLPIVGRATSIVTTIAGGAALAAIGFFVYSQLGGEQGLHAIQWGSYLAGGAGLLTLISGLAGIRGE